jgi:hypothetical protein
MNRSSLTQHLRLLEDQFVPALAAPERFECAGGQYTIRVANDLESRRKAYQLVYGLYLEKEYAQPHPSRMWLSIFDALPETTTLLVERTDTGAAVGALTVVFDSPMGLPADNLYRPELNALRAAGRKLSEIVSLGVAEEPAAGPQILVKLFNFVYLLAKKVRGASDFMITVNPRHVRFYQRTLLFEAAGPERSYGKVGGAPALLLRLDLAIPEERVRLEHGCSGDINSHRLGHAEAASSEPTALASQGGGSLCPPNTRKSRTLYPMFHAPAEEPAIVAGLASALKPMTEQELGYFFVSETDILREASPEQRAHLQNCYLAWNFEMVMAVEPGS